MSENENRRSYDWAFKVEAVRLVTQQRRKVTEVARELGINPNQLHRWKRLLSEESLKPLAHDLIQCAKCVQSGAELLDTEILQKEDMLA